MFKYLMLFLAAFSVSFSAIADQRPVLLSLSTSTITAGESITVYTNGLSSGSPKDWVGLYRINEQDDFRYLDWVYTGSCTKRVPLGDQPTPGGCTFHNLAPGSYVFRMFANNGYGLMGDSSEFTVLTHPPRPISSVEIYAKSYNSPFVSIGVRYMNNFAVSVTDWLGLYRMGPDGRGTFVTWKYTNTCSSIPGPGPIPYGRCTFENLSPGARYQVILFSNNGYSVIAASDEFDL